MRSAEEEADRGGWGRGRGRSIANGWSVCTHTLLLHLAPPTCLHPAARCDALLRCAPSADLTDVAAGRSNEDASNEKGKRKKCPSALPHHPRLMSHTQKTSLRIPVRVAMMLGDGDERAESFSFFRQRADGSPSQLSQQRQQCHRRLLLRTGGVRVDGVVRCACSSRGCCTLP